MKESMIFKFSVKVEENEYTFSIEAESKEEAKKKLVIHLQTIISMLNS